MKEQYFSPPILMVGLLQNNLTLCLTLFPMQYITSGYQNVNVIIFQHFGTKLCHHNLNSLTLENLKFEPPSQQCPSDAKSIFLSFFQIDIHCVKSDQIRSFFQSIFSCIRTEYRKIRTRKNSLFEHFSRSDFSNLQRQSQSQSFKNLAGCSICEPIQISGYNDFITA